MKSSKIERVKELLIIAFFLIAPVFLYHLIKKDPIIGFDEEGDPIRVGIYIMFILFWGGAYFIYKYYTEAKEKKEQNEALETNCADIEKSRKEASIIDGYKFNQRICKYDSKNQCIEEIHISNNYLNDENDPNNDKWTYKYDNSNNLIEEIQYGSGKLLFKTIFKYDSKNNLVEQIEYDDEGVFEYKTLYKYDSDNKLLESLYFNEDNKLRDKTKYKYDSNGNCIERSYYKDYQENRDNNFDIKTIFKYDFRGNCIDELHYKSDNSISERILYKYDKNNRVIMRIEENRFSNASLKVTTIRHLLKKEMGSTSHNTI